MKRKLEMEWVANTLHTTSEHGDSAPFKTAAESHLSAPPPFHRTTSMFVTATAHSPVLPHIEASTEVAFVLLITTPQTQEFTVRYPPRTTSQVIITH